MKKSTLNEIKKDIKKNGECIIRYQPTLKDLDYLEDLGIYCEPMNVEFNGLADGHFDLLFFRYFA